MKHLRSIRDLSRDDLHRLLALTDHMAEVNRRPNPKVPALRGRMVCNIFFEDSTRTRLSFETAAKRLSADTMNFAVSSSSVNKGESLRDTIETEAGENARLARRPPPSGVQPVMPSTPSDETPDGGEPRSDPSA